MKHLEGEANGRRHDQTYILPASMKALPKEGEASSTHMPFHCRQPQ
ncbi:hypothetical protein FDH10_gp27 [Propionibacterium phage Doucette]|uniref:Uncharacterized protein n=1 Tax=Propionibacterium phage Doucette TaxID=1897534 RepID=A0A1D8ETW9_9CAUD|nr:hypothetical protein FDH10_gp27 [Propionibacterium phage Doucette]AOT24440.1 hypothetical protein DOUCETTE_27 [Propionibacterium phage Doucette]